MSFISRKIFISKSDTLLWDSSTISSESGYVTAFGADKFISLQNNSVNGSYSEDGINWNPITIPSSSIEGALNIVYGGSKFVLLNRYSGAVSIDGINWQETETPIITGNDGIWKNLAYGNGRFIASTSITSGSRPGGYSDDGITWTGMQLPTSTTNWILGYGNGLFVAVNSGGNNAAYSTDGISWTKTSNISVSSTVESIVFANNRFIASGPSSRIAYSTNGINWTNATLPTSNASGWRALTFGNDRFIIIGKNSNKLCYSYNGINWIQSSLPQSNSWSSMAFGLNKFVVTSDNSNVSLYSK